MITAQTQHAEMLPELEAIAQAAYDRLQAQAGGDLSAEREAQQSVAHAAGNAIAAGAALGAIAEAERVGQARARRALSSDVLRQVARAAKRRRDAESEYEQAVERAGRIGLSQRDIAQAAEVSHGTVRAILGRMGTDANGGDPKVHGETELAADDNGSA